MKKLIYFIVLFLVLSCEKDEYTEDPYFSGFYQIDVIKSTELVDLNNDGNLSSNLKNEIDNYFNNEIYDLEIRPNYTNDYKNELISFYLPEAYLYFDYPSEPDGYAEYTRGGFGIKYKYKDTKIVLNNQLENNQTSTIINKFELIGNNRIWVNISKEFYDFGINDWKNLNLEIIYIKN